MFAYVTCMTDSLTQLELTVTKLRAILALSPDQVDSISSPLARMRELEQENEILLQELEDLRSQLAKKDLQPRLCLRDADTYISAPDDYPFDREANHRGTVDTGDIYVSRCSPCTTYNPSSVALHRHLFLTTTLHWHFDHSPFRLSPVNPPRPDLECRLPRHTHDSWVATTRMMCQHYHSRRHPERWAQ